MACYTGITQLVERRALSREVLGSNLPLVVPEVTLGSYSSGSLTISRCKIWTRLWEFRVDSKDHYTGSESRAQSNDGSTLL